MIVVEARQAGLKPATAAVVQRLLASDEPSVRLRILTCILDCDDDSSEARAARTAVRSSPRTQTLLSERDEEGRIPCHPYAKWRGAHWVLASLADMGYPPGDETLIPLREQVYGWLLGRSHQKGIRVVDDRVRRCASQEGNALYYLLALGLGDARTDRLAERLVQWQWPDGGWNCDRKPEAANSSFMESLIPLRGLALHARVTGSAHSALAAERAAEIFLKRRLFRRQRDGTVIHSDFLRLHYPCYWHYDILSCLVVLTEAGMIRDARCEDALDVLEAKQLPDGGFPAHAKYYRATGTSRSGRSLVDWGGTGQRRLNEFVTAYALCVLQQSGRLD